MIVVYRKTIVSLVFVSVFVPVFVSVFVSVFAFVSVFHGLTCPLLTCASQSYHHHRDHWMFLGDKGHRILEKKRYLLNLFHIKGLQRIGLVHKMDSSLLQNCKTLPLNWPQYFFLMTQQSTIITVTIIKIFTFTFNSEKENTFIFNDEK